jgi:parallel beta-helix repeat protein
MGEFSVDKEVFSSINVCDNVITDGMIDIGLLYRFENQPHPVLKDVLVDNNSITSSVSGGIQVYGRVHMSGEEYIYDCINATVTNNTISQWKYNNGILVNWADGGVISGNFVKDGFGGNSGIGLLYSENFEVRDNKVENCKGGRQIVGMDLREVKNTVLTGNVLTGNQMNFAYTPGGETTPNMVIDTTNIADGRSIYYYEDKKDLTVDASMDPAALYVLSCANVVVEGISPSTNDVGIAIFNTIGAEIKGCDVRHNYNDIVLSMSSDCTVQDNKVEDALVGIMAYEMTDSQLSNNFINYTEVSVQIPSHSNNLNISGNEITNSNSGFWLYYFGLEAGGSVDIVDNNISEGISGVFLESSDGGNIRRNNFRNMSDSAFYAKISKSCIFENNTVNNLKDDPEKPPHSVVMVNSMTYAENKTIYRGGDHQVINNNFYSPSQVYIGNSTFGITDKNNNLSRWAATIDVPTFSEEVDIDPSRWNITKTPGTNIVGGPYFGGNYWASPDGTGFSQTHPDRGDGFCDESYVFDEINSDKLPLHTGAEPAANFTGTPLSGYAPLTVTFSDFSTGNIAGWEWSFGDGQISAEKSPVHTYTASGTYSVTLNVTGPAGSDKMIRAGYITVANRPSGGGGSSGGGSSGSSSVSTFSGSGSLITSSQGKVLKNVQVDADDGVGEIIIPKGTDALNKEGKPLSEVSISPIEMSPSGADLPEGFSFAGYAYECGPDGATFNPSAELVFTFSDAEWNELISSGQPLVLVFVGKDGVTEEIPVEIDKAGRTVKAAVTHFSTYYLMHAGSEYSQGEKEPEPEITPGIASETPGSDLTKDSTPQSSGLSMSILAIAMIVMAVFAGYYSRRQK